MENTELQTENNTTPITTDEKIKNFVVSNMTDIKALMNARELTNICKKYKIGAYEDYHDEQQNLEDNVIDYANQIVELTHEIAKNPVFFFQSQNCTDVLKKSFFEFAKNCIDHIEHQQKMQELNVIFVDNNSIKYELVDDDDCSNDETESNANSDETDVRHIRVFGSYNHHPF